MEKWLEMQAIPHQSKTYVADKLPRYNAKCIVLQIIWIDSLL